MKFEALVRVEVIVPFEHDAPALDLDRYVTETVPGVHTVTSIPEYEEHLAAVNDGRVEAARRAESEVVDKLRALLDSGDIEYIDAVVVEVREPQP